MYVFCGILEYISLFFDERGFTMFKLKLHTQVLLGIIFGIVAGVVLRENAVIFKPAGDVFLNLLKMIIVPLVFASLVMGVVNLGNVQNLGKIGVQTFVYYLSTTFVAVCLGLVLVNLIQPGVGANIGIDVDLSKVNAIRQNEIDFVDFFTQLVPENIVASMVEGKMLPLIFFSIFMGCGLNAIGKKGEGFARFVDGLNELMMTVTQWIMHLAPLGVFALMATLVGKTGMAAVKPLAMYMGVVLLGLFLHMSVVLSSILIFVAKTSPIVFFRKMFPALATAFSTDSSLVTLPVTMDCLEERVGVSNKVTGFVTPIGATVNMDGTALYEGVAVMFIAQIYGVDLSLTQQIVVCLTATLASIGAAGIPSAGLVTMIIVLRAVDLPIEGIGLILAVDRILDMFRTTVNVFGDSCGAISIARLNGEVFD